MIIEILVICLLTNTDPYYDCNEKWKIIIYDDDYIVGLNPDYHYIGFTDLIKKEIRLSNSHLSDKDIYGNSLLIHELKHMKCKCNWHDGAIVTFG